MLTINETTRTAEAASCGATRPYRPKATERGGHEGCGVGRSLPSSWSRIGRSLTSSGDNEGRGVSR